MSEWQCKNNGSFNKRDKIGTKYYSKNISEEQMVLLRFNTSYIDRTLKSSFNSIEYMRFAIDPCMKIVLANYERLLIRYKSYRRYYW